MNLFKIIFISVLILFLQACATPPLVTEDDDANQKNEEITEVPLADIVDELGDRITAEGVKVADDLLNVGKDKVDSFLKGMIKPKDTESPEQDDSGGVIKTGGTNEQIPVEVLQIYDGDTIEILYNGIKVNFRYLLIDAPESVHPTKEVQPFSIEASNRNKELLNSGNVTIEFDVGDRYDKYQRLLGYIYVDGVSINELLIREGLARVAYVYPPNTRYLEDYKNAEQEAKEKGVGIWSIEN